VQPAPASSAIGSTASGVDFVHESCGSGRKLLVEINSGGVSLLDYDGDGDLDLFFAQGAPLRGSPRRREGAASPTCAIASTATTATSASPT
jgi:hypothetical protein